jgi:hypothetical protein
MKAYSYQRFSSPEQRKGASIARQTEKRNAFIAKHGLTLDTSVKMIDAGVSAHRGKHRQDKHCLGAFLKRVDAGEIPVGSYLIIESLDRLTREEVGDGLELLLSITRAGINVVQLEPVEVIYKKPVQLNQLLIGIMELQRGWSESKMKSERVGDSWKRRKQKARESNAVMTGVVPFWLKREGDKIVVRAEGAKIVKRIFEMSAAGMGLTLIVKKLNAENIPTPRSVTWGDRGRWNTVSLNKLLRNESVLGIYQPRDVDCKTDGEPIEGYYPAVIDSALFYRVQKGLSARRRNGVGRSTSNTNILKGLLFYPLENRNLIHKTHTTHKAGKTYVSRLYCSPGGFDGTGKFVSFPVKPLEESLLACLEEINPADIFPVGGKKTNNMDKLRGLLAAIEIKLKRIEDKMVDGDEIDALVNAAKRLQDERKRLLKEIDGEKQKASSPKVEQYQTLLAALHGKGDNKDNRLRIRAALSQVIERIDCCFVREGQRQCAVLVIYFAGVDAVRILHIWHRPRLGGKRILPEFTKWATDYETINKKAAVVDWPSLEASMLSGISGKAWLDIETEHVARLREAKSIRIAKAVVRRRERKAKM